MPSKWEGKESRCSHINQHLHLDQKVRNILQVSPNCTEERWKSAQCKLDLLVLTHIDCNQTEKSDIFCRSIRTRRRTNVLEPRVRKGARCSAEAQGASEESVHCVGCFGTVEQLSEAATAIEELVLAEKESEATYLKQSQGARNPDRSIHHLIFKALSLLKIKRQGDLTISDKRFNFLQKFLF